MEPWRVKLIEGETEAAWALFSERYRPLILATIRRTVHDSDNVHDVFAHVCQVLVADDLARLKRFSEKTARAARFSTWLVTVVHHQTVDWLRQQDRNFRRTGSLILAENHASRGHKTRVCRLCRAIRGK